MLEEQCLDRQIHVLRGHSESIGERLLRDPLPDSGLLANHVRGDALMSLPPVPYDACEKVSTRATSISMVRYRSNDYSVPVAFAHPLPGRACSHAREGRGSGARLCQRGRYRLR
jgi:Mu transposase-like protein